MPKHLVFFSLMAIASAISIAKSAVLAAVLPTLDFSHYAAVVALTGILSSFVSFGLTEGMVKKFTRLIAFGRKVELRADLSAGVRQLTRRYTLILLFVGTVCLAWQRQYFLPAISAVLIAYAVGCFSIAGSVLRGYGRLITMAWSSIVRSLLALVAAASVGYYFGWKIGITAEAISTSLVGILFLFYLRGLIRTDAETTAPLSLDGRFVATERDGFLLFVAFTLAMIPVSLDRMWVVYFSPGMPAAQYAFSGIFVAAAITLTSIYVQKLGPELVRDRALGKATTPLKLAGVHAFAVAAILVAGASATFFIIHQFFYDVYWARFSLSPTIAALIVFASAAQVSPIFDWSLIALDGEKGVLFSSIVLVVVTALLFMWNTVSGGGLEGYLLSVAAGRTAQILTASFWINRLQIS